MARSSIRSLRHAQAGVVLITAMIFIVVLTLIVLALMRSATLEERMAANARDRQLALQAAEAVVRDAGATLFPTSGAAPGAPIEPFNLAGFTAGCTNGYCSPPGGAQRWKTISWTDTAITRTFAVPANSNLAVVSAQPRYIVEYVGQSPGGQPGGICPRLLFRVTARGVGRDTAAGRGESVVFVESTFRYQPAAFADGSCGA